METAWSPPPLTLFTLPLITGGTGSAYVNPAMLTQFGAQASALKRVTNDVQNASCVAASSQASSLISGRYPLPLVAFDYDLAMPVAHMAIWICLSDIGRNPEAGWDDQIDQRYHAAIDFLTRVQKQSANLNVTANYPSPPQFNMPAVLTHRSRGWEGRGGRFGGGWR